MPTYQYACTNPDCGSRFELVQSFTDPAVTECPACEQPVRKVYGSVGVVFKGSGFYRTDSRAAANGSSAAKSDSSTKTDSGGKGSTAKKESTTNASTTNGSGASTKTAASA